MSPNGTSSPSLSLQRRPVRHVVWLAGFVALVTISIALLDWDLSRLATPTGRDQAIERLLKFVGALTSPDLSSKYLSQCLRWAHETVTTALAGTLLGVLLGWVLALGASRSFMLDGLSRRNGPVARAHAGLRWVFMEVCRLALDVLRGVPDFIWGIILIPAIGTGRLTGTLAIGLGVAGILGKIYSELWDSVPQRRVEPLRSLGAGSLAVHMYGIQPLAARSMMSFTLMRAECAIRNASVLGVIIGGGLGGAIGDELSNGDYARVGTVVLCIFSVTTVADVISNLLRRQFRNDPNHPRASRGTPRKQIVATFIGVALAAGVFGWAIADHLIPKQLANSNMIVSEGFSQPAKSDLTRAIEEMGDIASFRWMDSIVEKYMSPDLSWHTVAGSLESVGVPFAVAVVGTSLAVLGAILLAWMSSVAFQIEPHRFSGERTISNRAGIRIRRSIRWTVFGLGKLIALVSRSVPEVLWALILMRLFSLGTIPGVLAISIHSMGVLARVFTETVDNIPYRRLEQAYLGSRRVTFFAVAVPVCWRDWMTYSFFQFEANVRMSMVLGLVGLAGLGMAFSEAQEWAIWGQASTLLITMVLVTTVIDRTSRALKLSRSSST